MSRGRGRPRKFDETEVRQAIMRCFWAKGYAATTLDDLAKATGLVRPSLYGAFGGKEDMFLAAMDDFAARTRAYLVGKVPADAPLDVVLRAVFSAMLDLYLTEDGGRGCLVFSTAGAEAPAHPQIREKLLEKLNQSDDQFRRLLERHAPSAAPQNLETAAGLAAAALHSMGLRARSGVARSTLEEFAESAANSIAALVDCAGARRTAD
ncbi:TetR/AcrR family transcriptional regulator [Leisingera sp. JC11]|uniref:TetR/AcrR family transcriptional regulator n=1 Tax=Leisingera sp. JC11 TaxID=3042469 RepID=UPI003454718D